MGCCSRGVAQGLPPTGVTLGFPSRGTPRGGPQRGPQGFPKRVSPKWGHLGGSQVDPPIWVLKVGLATGPSMEVPRGGSTDGVHGVVSTD